MDCEQHCAVNPSHWMELHNVMAAALQCRAHRVTAQVCLLPTIPELSAALKTAIPSSQSRLAACTALRAQGMASTGLAVLLSSIHVVGSLHIVLAQQRRRY